MTIATIQATSSDCRPIAPASARHAARARAEHARRERPEHRERDQHVGHDGEDDEEVGGDLEVGHHRRLNVCVSTTSSVAPRRTRTIIVQSPGNGMSYCGAK